MTKITNNSKLTQEISDKPEQPKIKLNEIFTISTLKDFFLKYKIFFATFNRSYLRHIKKSILASIRCCDPKYGRTVFVCETCNLKAFRPMSCKSRFCTSCGSQYAIDWAQKVVDTLIDCQHRSCLFTIPDVLWNLTIHKREILSELSDEINVLLKYHFNKAGIISFGLIVNIHTFGRDSKFNTHFHVLMSEGGFTKKGKFKSLRFIHGETLASFWKERVLAIFRKHFKDSKEKLKIINSTKNTNYFVDIKGKTLKNNQNSIKYFGRYLSRPAISENRIIGFDGKNVTFWYKDVDTHEEVTLVLPLFQFICRLILHIPPKGFKMVRRYGFYARRCSELVKSCLLKFKGRRLFSIEKLPWRERMRTYLGRDPLVCPNCNKKMVVQYIYHETYGTYNYT
jgi:hypothetical protein